MPSDKITALDVARLAKVSPATVSRVFHHHAQVAPSIRQRVLAAAGQLQYMPRRTGGDTVIAALPVSMSHYFSAVLAGIRSGLESSEYQLELADMMRLKFPLPPRVAGVITVNDLNCLPPEVRRELQMRKAKLLTVNQEVKDVPSLSSDQAAGIGMAVDHLAANGHRAIACVMFCAEDIAPEQLNFAKQQRIGGFQTALGKHGITYHPKMIFGTSAERLVETVAKILNSGATAIIMAEEGGGLPLQYALALLHRQIPRDISVISYEISHISPYLSPPHTAIDQDVFALGQAAAKRMIDLAAGIDDQPLHVRLANHLHLRDSVAPLTNQ